MTTGERDEDAIQAWRAATCASLLSILLAGVGFIYFPVPLGSPLMIARLAEIGWGLLLLAYLIGKRGRPALRSSLAVYALGLLPLIAIQWTAGVEHEMDARGWEPFIRQKFFFLLFALLSPGEIAVSAALIAVLAVETCLEYWVGGLRYSPHIGRGEPWITLFFAVIAVLVLVRHGRAAAHRRALQEQLREREAVERLARVTLAVRDLANTPLQTLRFGVESLQMNHVTPEQIDSMRRALVRIGELEGVIGAYEANMRWRPGDESFDALAIIRSGGA